MASPNCVSVSSEARSHAVLELAEMFCAFDKPFEDGLWRLRRMRVSSPDLMAVGINLSIVCNLAILRT